MSFTEVAQQCAQELIDLIDRIRAQLAAAGGTSQDVQAITSQWMNDQAPLVRSAAHWLVEAANSLDQTGGTAAEAHDADHNDSKEDSQ